jgi:hypothetical protein
MVELGTPRVKRVAVQRRSASTGTDPVLRERRHNAVAGHRQCSLYCASVSVANGSDHPVVQPAVEGRQFSAAPSAQ